MRRHALVLALFVWAALSLLGAPLKCYPYCGAIAADANGRVLFEDGADRLAYPASVSKLMTMLLVVEDVSRGLYTYETEVVATPEVRKSEPSWLDLKPGDRITVRDLLYALMVESANDGAIALAVKSAGSLDGFVARMNERAAQLGMDATKYYNPNGLPPNAKLGYPWKAYNVTTARDQLKLAIELLKYPEVRVFTSAQACDLIRTASGYRVSLVRAVNRAPAETHLRRGERIVRRIENHNNIMCKPQLRIMNPDGRNAVDGFKTGYIDDGGSSIVLTAAHQNKRVVAVVLGSDGVKNAAGKTIKKSAVVRDESARRILLDALGAVSW